MELDRDPERGEESRDSWRRLRGGETQEETRLSIHVFYWDPWPLAGDWN